MKALSSAAVAVVVCLLAPFLTSAFDEFDRDEEDARQIMNLLSKSRTPEALKVKGGASAKGRAVSSMTSFDWNDCGSSSDVAHVKSLTLSPNPLRLPGNVTVGFQWQTTTDLSSPIAMDIQLKKKVGPFWFTVPCEMIPGSCHRANICQDLSPVTCPPDFETCHCPFRKGVYTLVPTTLIVKQGGVPSGDYRATAWIKQGNTEVGCVHLELSVA